MFANPIWSVLILAALVVFYIVVRIKHGKPLTQAFDHLRGWEWLKTWVIRFRSWVVYVIGGVLIALPDIIVQITPANLALSSERHGPEKIGAGMLIFNAINTAIRTKRPAWRRDMWNLILGFIGGPVIKGVIDGYKAKLAAGNTTERIAGRTGAA
jgi:hypothetical protein